MTNLYTREDVAKLFRVSTRTIDRWRSQGLDLGMVQAYPGALPRFKSETVDRAIAEGGFRKLKQPKTSPKPVGTATLPAERRDGAGSSGSQGIGSATLPEPTPPAPLSVTTGQTGSLGADQASAVMVTTTVLMTTAAKFGDNLGDNHVGK
ncbi:MAG: hypothetical protein K2X82_25730 [Gemmataceae bacterium]|nr:hypothetical protein [Gemmataceae bacterium]